MTKLDEPSREFAFSKADFEDLRTLVRERTGIVLQDHKRNMVYSRLARRLRTLGLRSFADYRKRLEGREGPEEIVFLINAITTNLTKFFREGHHFDHLGSTVMSEVSKGQGIGKNKMRIWSAGCSSGEEPYTIAMTVRGRLPGIEKYDAKILATDLDTNMLDRGRNGLYSAEDAKGIPAEYQRKYVDLKSRESEGLAVMSKDLRKLIAFKHLNLLEKWPMHGPFDAIFCRNVMIYFDNPTKQKLVEQFAALLRKGGWLYVGHSETLTFARDSFEMLGRTIYRKIDK
ncbi:chemotaxis protein CheR [Hwanghaeella grinnelliae]|uniref:Chemotaxis protein methyltransferase n=1 Tax=Hwanghaeella grinnelliae TaxID=2500179 RepID=A0A3S2VND5_9PROT|nr:protein-glutamate O-methyltransferase [Hwanghaeella grinnelliae]RVU37765.1 chemotaxis protein CheR [Hwanghaeella grinnelliae]